MSICVNSLFSFECIAEWLTNRNEIKMSLGRALKWQSIWSDEETLTFDLPANKRKLVNQSVQKLMENTWIATKLPPTPLMTG